MNELERLTFDQFRALRSWDPMAAAMEEDRRINAHLHDTAAELFHQATVPSEAAIEERAQSACEILEGVFVPRDLAQDPELTQAAQHGLIKRNAPALARVLAFQVLSYLLLVTEMVIAVVLVAYGDASALVLLPATILAGGAWVAGDGLAGIFRKAYPNLLPQYIDAFHAHAVASWMRFLVGTAAVAGVSYLRYRATAEDGAPTIAFLTLGLAIILILVKAFFDLDRFRFERSLDLMFRAAQIQAKLHHEHNASAAIQNKSGPWRAIFKRETQTLLAGVKQARELATSSRPPAVSPTMDRGDE